MIKKEERLEFAKLLLSNERAFHLLFSDLRRYDSFSLLHNRAFAEDPVFNHFIINDSILEDQPASEDMIRKLIGELKTAAMSIGFRTTVFLETFWRNSLLLEKVAISEGYRISEKMEILSKRVGADNALNLDSGINVSETSDFKLWNRLFMDSFEIPQSWETELLRKDFSILENRRVKLLLAREKGSEVARGCLLTFVIPQEVMGIYGVGTDPRWRGRGIARAMIAFAEEKAREAGCSTLTLQTVSSDGVSPMYKKMGYTTVFERDIIWHPLSG